MPEAFRVGTTRLGKFRGRGNNSDRGDLSAKRAGTIRGR